METTNLDATYKTLLVGGTWAKGKESWDDLHSNFRESAKNHGIQFISIDQGFQWTTELDGILGDNHAWAVAAINLIKFHNENVSETVNIIAHSHGGQVALMAAAAGMPIKTLITVDSPVRGDMKIIYKKAKKNINKWIHIHTTQLSLWAFLGGLGDWDFKFTNKMKEAEENIGFKGHDHSSLMGHEFWDKENLWRLLA